LMILARLIACAGTWKTKAPSKEGGEGKGEALDKLDTLAGKMQREMAKLRDKYQEAKKVPGVVTGVAPGSVCRWGAVLPFRAESGYRS
jgi:hypothetical protein